MEIQNQRASAAISAVISGVASLKVGATHDARTGFRHVGVAVVKIGKYVTIEHMPYL